jgi:hypothetical protein
MSFQEELEKILTDLVKQNGAELMHERLKHPSIEKALTSIINLVEKEVIGEDTPYDMNNHGSVNAKNFLRSQQRAIIRGNDE